MKKLCSVPSLLLLALAMMLPGETSAQSPCNRGRTSTDARSPYAECLPVVGVQSGPIGSIAEQFGDEIVPLGRLAGDSLPSWIVGRTYVPEGGAAHELLIFHGVAGALPDSHSGVRLGPTERASATHAIAAGDWDADGNIDIATSIEIFGDTTAGNHGHQVEQLVIWWGQPDGSFTLADTTRLECGAQIWIGPGPGCSVDADGDGALDFFAAIGQVGMNDGELVPIPGFHLFKGKRDDDGDATE